MKITESVNSPCFSRREFFKHPDAEEIPEATGESATFWFDVPGRVPMTNTRTEDYDPGCWEPTGADKEDPNVHCLHGCLPC